MPSVASPAMAKNLEELTEKIELDVQHIPVEQVKPDPDNPNEMSDSDYAALKAEIRDHGYTQPVLVRPIENGFRLIDGEHRWRAVCEIGFASVPAVVIDTDEDDAKVRLVAMNRLRGKFVPLKLAYVIADLAQRIPESDLRKRLGMTESELQDHLRNANLSDAVAESLAGANPRPEGRNVSVFCSEDDAAMIEATLDLIAPQKEDRGAALARVCKDWADTQATA
jgi:ParB/RepB/Spo0J family partition protein